MTIKRIVKWINKAVPEPNEKNFNTQLGCHAEEFAEMLETLEAHEKYAQHDLDQVKLAVEHLARSLKSGRIKVKIKDRVEFLDAICDQIVTATGAATFTNMDTDGALNEVVDSLESKFDDDGQPIFDENQKIMKGPNYFKPNLLTFLYMHTRTE